MNRVRLPDWEARLYSFLHEARTASLSWGEFDCVIGLVAGAVEAQTGERLGAEFLHSYTNETEALHVLRDKGWLRKGDDMDVALARMISHFLRPAKTRHRGNVVLLTTEEGPAFGIRTGRDAQAFCRSGVMRLFRIPDGTPEWTVT